MHPLLGSSSTCVSVMVIACGGLAATSVACLDGCTSASPAGGGAFSSASPSGVAASGANGTSSTSVNATAGSANGASGATVGTGASSTGGGTASSSGPSAQDASADTSPATLDAAGSSSDGGPSQGPTPSAGCGRPPPQAVATYVQYNINVTGLAQKYASMYTARNYYVYLPTDYDATRPYMTVFLGPGCGGNGSQVLPMQNASGKNAILVGLSPVGQCFETSDADSPEINFFDAVLSTVESSFCVDQAHVFIAGFSSGSWLANLIGCARAGIVRGQGNATGGLPPVPTCAGPIAAMLAHDEGDPANNISGGEAARDRILKINGCSLTETTPYDAGRPSMCVQYEDCPVAFPVVWCPTTGQGHSDQVSTGLSVPGFWNFWEALP
jgi:poly(3-hydroxybutyrate) depolymerase